MKHLLPLLFVATVGTVAAQPSLTTPRGGWRYSDAQQKDFLQTVTYPASNVNASEKSAAALIQGHLGQASKAGSRQPARLIVDGVAVPLLTNPDGSFARPWSFGAGSHGVEVRAPGSEKAKRVQFIEAQAGRARTRLRVVLSWDSDSTDLDLHVVSPDGQHVFFANRVVPNGAALDVDVTTGFGPEIYATPSPVPGPYHVFVNYFGAGDRSAELTTAQVAVITDEGTPREKQQVLRVPLRNPGELTRVHSFLMP